ncbi:MAG: superoxide dismutase [Candidatus Paceibacteria bacterium]
MTSQQRYPFKLPPLPYSYDALEPYIDAKTMEIHHTKHHQGYVDKLNAAMERWPEGQAMELSDILKDLNAVAEDIRTQVRNHGGGHFNHSLFWQMMKPGGGGKPTGAMLEAIRRDFGEFEKFKEAFTNAALGIFGSGWAWLAESDGKLQIVTTPNQDTPLSQNLKPILGIDVWEHAYYLKYQNRRPEYVEAWWNVINWDEVESNLKQGI